MSCQSLTPATRAFEPDKENLTFHRSVRFSSESRTSTRKSESEAKRDAHGSLSLSTLSMGHHVTPTTSMSQSAPPPSTIDLDDIPTLPTQTCRFPKLEECAHFHYERVNLGGIQVETIPCSEDDACSTHCDDNTDNEEGWICLKVRSHIHSPPALIEPAPDRSMNTSWEASDVCEWSLTRNVENLLLLDDNLHSCVYDRKVSRLPKLSEVLTPSMIKSANYHSVIEDYMRRLSRVADDSMICGPVLNWLQMDNKGHKLLVANEDSSSINTPAVAAAYSVRKYVSQARDEISFEVGDMISIIDMPGPQESVWWRGKRGFKVGFFPHHCVAVIGDKVPRHMTQPPPIVGSVAVTTIKPVLRKHGKLISLFRSFILSRPSRRSLKQQGILKERVFGCDLGEHLLNCGYDVPLVLKECAQIIESRGPTDGVYRLSGTANVTQTLRATYDGTCQPNPTLTADTHALASLLKMYFRELPNPLCTYQLYESFVYAVQSGVPDEEKLQRMKDTVAKLPPPHYRTLGYLMRHLRRVSLLGHLTGMTARNMAIVWAPNLLRSPHSQHALTGVAVQAVVTEFLICYAEQLFSEENQPTEQEAVPEVITRHEACGKRPKSLPPNAPARLLSLEEARRRGKSTTTPPLPSIVIPQLSISHPTKYIEVGSGPNNLPQYHTVLPAPNKRGLKRSPSGWKGLFSRSKLRIRPTPPPTPTEVTQEIDVTMVASALRPVKSCESLQSESDTLGPLLDTNSGQLKSHTRSASCDSYFEQWQLELADMRLRLSPQERDHNIFSEEDDTTANIVNGLQGASICSSPVCSDSCSAEPSPRKLFTLNETDNERKRSKLTEEMNTIGYIDGESPVRLKPAEKRHSDEWVSSHTNTDIAKRVCKDRDSPKASLAEFPSPLGSVKLRERSSPRKTKNPTIRYSGLHQPLMLTEKPVTVTNTNCQNQPRMSWHGAKDHSTLIKIDWPIENSVNSLTASTLNSSPLTPLTPIYDPLIDSDSELKGCDNCKDDKKCLKCELTECSDYENLTTDFDNHNNKHVTVTEENKLETDISYQNLNRLSAISTNSSASDPNSAKKSDGVYENVVKDIRNSVMTSSHESSSSFSKHSDELFECYGFARPNYINLQSSTSSKSSNSSPLKSPLKSTISITFRSPTKSCKSGDYEALDTPKNERDSVYEDIDLEKNLSIVEEATIPQTDASLPTQDACQPDSIRDLIILETPTEEQKEKPVDIYNQVKFFKQSVEEVNAMVLESPENKGEEDGNAYENIDFVEIKNVKDYENIEVTKNCDSLTVAKDIKPEQKSLLDMDTKSEIELDNGNTIKAVTKNLNVKQLATRFESPTEQKGPFNFKISTLERKKEEIVKKDLSLKLPPPISPKTYKLNKCSISARSLDENAFVKEFGAENVQYIDKININDTKKDNNKTQDLDLNLNLEEIKIDEPITPTSENKLSLIQRFDDSKATESKTLTEADKKLSRERIEKYKEERRNFLREKYSSQSFRSNNPSEHLVRLKVKKNEEGDNNEEDNSDNLPKFERRNTVDLGQRMRFSLAKSANNLDTIQSPDEQRDDVKMSNVAESSHHKCDSGPRSGDFDRKEKISPSYNIKDMAAMFEQKSQNSTNG